MRKIIRTLHLLLIRAVHSVIISAVFTFCKWILSLFGACNTPTWANFLWGAVGIFALFFLYCVWDVAITLYRYHKDPVFMYCNMNLGLKWKDHQRFKREREMGEENKSRPEHNERSGNE